MKTRAAAHGAETRALVRELREQRKTLGALIHQVGLAMETLSVIRADQLRIIQQGPHVHFCSDGKHGGRAGRKGGGGHGR